jgi:hypothetical protein
VRALSADEAKNAGKRVLIEKSGTLFLTDPSGANPRRIVDDGRLAALSTDGNLISYSDDKGVYVLSLLDGQSVTVGRVTEGHVESLTWSGTRNTHQTVQASRSL